MTQPSIQEYYIGKNVFVTGATGFVGKVLVEKLLWSCHDIGKIFIIVRSKKGKDVQERVDEIIKTPVFDRLREKNPSQLKKIVALEGDITEDNLGFSQHDQEIFFNEVNVIFHSAASIKLDEPIKDAIRNNSLSTKRLVSMAHKIKQLEVFVHVSTAFSNYYRNETAEVPYLPPYDPNAIFELIQSLPDNILNEMEPILLKSNGGRNFPNTYTYSKYLAEAIVTLEGEGLPRAIVRPSVVTATLNEPMPGWIDNWGGPNERMVNVSKGLIKYIDGNPNAIIDLIPADMVVNTAIAAGYKTALEEPKFVQVYNCATGWVNPIKYDRFFGYVEECARKYPYDKVLSVPSVIFSNSYFARTFLPFLLHHTPAFFIDLSRRLQGKKPIMMRLHDTLDGFYAPIKFVIKFDPNFVNEKSQKLALSLSTKDQKEFPFDVRAINWKECTDSYVLGLKKYLLKEDCSKEAMNRGLQRINRLNRINRGAKFAFLGASLVLAGSIINNQINSNNETKIIN